MARVTARGRRAQTAGAMLATAVAFLLVCALFTLAVPR